MKQWIILSTIQTPNCYIKQIMQAFYYILNDWWSFNSDKHPIVFLWKSSSDLLGNEEKDSLFLLIDLDESCTIRTDWLCSCQVTDVP